MRIPKPLRLAREATEVGQKMAEKLTTHHRHAPPQSRTARRLAMRPPAFTNRRLPMLLSRGVQSADAGMVLKRQGRGVC